MSAATLLLDIRPLLENPPFRRLWVGGTISGLGSQLGSFAVLYLVWQRTGSAALVGAMGIAQAVPMFAFALAGGRLADAVDRRTLVLASRIGQLMASVALAAIVIGGISAVWPVYVVIAVQSGLGAVSAPASKTFAVRLLSGEQLGAGLAMTNLGFQASMLIGPLVAGLLITWIGIGACLVIDTVTFLFALYGVARLPAMPPQPEPGNAATAESANGILAALRLIRREPILIGVFLADVSATVLAMPIALFPVINAEEYGGSASTLGLFLPALAVGGVLMGAFSGRLTRARRQGALMLVAGIVWGLALAGFGLSHVLWLALPALAIAGAADVASVVSRGTIVQRVTPDAFRGRVNALDFLVGAGGPQLGNLRAGLVASVGGGAFSAVVGGLAAAVGAIAIGVGVPTLRHYTQARDADRAISDRA
ncbi:MAG TPA: MFS transporter [Humibacter sp.]|nr:MFS transporter [Humibacter sp.]